MTDKATQVALMQQKSMAITLLLTLFFGPLGLFYTSVAGGVIMLILSILVGVFTFGFGLIATQVICVIWGAVATDDYNKKIMADIASQPTEKG